MLIFAYDSTDRLREMRTRGTEGVKNPENFAYVLNGSPLSGISNLVSTYFVPKEDRQATPYKCYVQHMVKERRH